MISSHIMKLSSLCSDINEKTNYEHKSPEKTTSISVTLKLLVCLVQYGEKMFHQHEINN